MSKNTSSNSDQRQARDKIKSIDELANISVQARAEGKTVALAHGIFDLIHMGHVRHLEAARKEGDVLVVTLTADQYVNKGPNRPVFTEILRAEMIAAMECVDWVGINLESSAESLITAIRPDAYIKGSDYIVPEDDITGKIQSERNAVEQHGGRVVFTHDITFSSSSLINKYMDVHDDALRAYLEVCQEKGAPEKIQALVNSVEDYRVLFVGDAIIDEYQYVSAMGKAAKENMIATRFLERELFAGGVFAAANHVADFCKEVEIITVLGKENSYEDLIRKSLKPNIKLTVVYRDEAPTTRKTRFIDSGYLRKLFEVYHFDDSPPDPSIDAEVVSLIKEKASQFDVTIATDFGHGLLSDRAIVALEENARFLAVNTQTNSANLGYNLITRYQNVDFVCIDAPEAQLATGDKFSDITEVVTEKLAKKINCDRFIVTHGKQGCVTYERSGAATRIPAFTKTVLDTVGAGDAFLSVASPLAATGADIELVGFVGNAAGAMKVGIVGHRSSVEKVPLLKYVATLLK